MRGFVNRGGLGIASQPGGTTGGGSPLSLPLVQSSTPLFTYMGSFNAPSSGTFQYGGGALSVGGNSVGVRGNLYANGIQQGNNDLGKMTIPAPTGTGGTYTGSETASQLTSGTTSVPLGALGGSSNTCVTGTLEYNGKLYVTGAIQYDANGDQNKFMVIGTTSVSGFGAACSASGTSGSINRMFSNGMGLVPSAWQSILGGPAYVFGGPGGGSALSINSQLACGYGFSTFDPATVTSGGTVNLKEWINYPYNNFNGRFCSVLSGFFQTTKANWPTWGDDLITQYDAPVGCAFIAPGSRSLVFLHHHVYGPTETSAGSDPCNSGASGSWCTPIAPDTQAYRRIQVVVYDLAAVLTANPNGTSASAPRPYAWWEFPNWKTLWGAGDSCGINFDCTGRESQSWATFDIYNNLLYVSMCWPGVNGTVYVFKVNSL